MPRSKNGGMKTLPQTNDPIRNLAYLRAYKRIVGGEPLYATGLLLYSSRLWMDRSVISRLTRDGYLRFDHFGKEAVFVLTDAGAAFLGNTLSE